MIKASKLSSEWNNEAAALMHISKH
jgi:hypothetical protein